jgi:hypothetical protein
MTPESAGESDVFDRHLSALIDEWTESGLITTDQAGAMRRSAPVIITGREASRTPGRRFHDVAAVEVLAYVGGVVVVAAAILIAAQYWGTLASGWRLVVLLAASSALLAAAVAMPTDSGGAGDRARAVLGLSSTLAMAGTWGVFSVDVLRLDDEQTALLVTTGTACYALALWLWRRHPLQQLVAALAVGLSFSAAIAMATPSDSLPGLGVWLAGLGYVLLASSGRLEPRSLGQVLGSCMAVIGAMATASSAAGTLLTLLTVLAIVAAATALSDLTLLVVGVLGLLVNLPAVVSRWFPDSTLMPYVLLVVGLLLVGAALWRATRQRHR